MFVELHILQNFAPSNLNRDDTNAPKDCEFGGYRRARISSQAIKRAMRRAFEQRNLVDEAHRAARTKRLHDELVRRFTNAGKSPEEAEHVFSAALQALQFAQEKKNAESTDESVKTEYLLFLGSQEIDALERMCLQYWDDLLKVKLVETAGKKRDAKVKASKMIPTPVRVALQGALDGGKAADVALFGRMLADLPQRNIDAASQVAHAISTNRVSTEFDFYTAVDDFKPEDTEGADMMGTVEFNSACFYRYANVDLGQLAHNLGNDAELAQKTLEAFIRAAVVAIPTGKQNSMAAQNPPSFVLAVVREDGLWSLANAFLKPVTPSATADLVTRSEQALASYWEQLATMYGTDGVRGAWFISLDGAGLEQLTASGVARVANLSQLVANVTAAANGSMA